MLEFARNEPVDIEVLVGLFARCGWADQQADLKLAWAIAASEEWIVCKLDGELIGFGRSCRLGPVKRVVFDLMVDPRFDHPLLRRRIVRMLAESAGGLEEVSVFRQRSSSWSADGRPLAAETVEGDVSGVGRGARIGRRGGRCRRTERGGRTSADRRARGADSSKKSDVYTGSMLGLQYPPAPPDAYLGGGAIIKEDR